jgi:ABC-type multidrug transport system ATPase subunit
MKNSPKIALSLTQRPNNLPDTIRVLLVPSENSWNDFRYKVRGHIGVRSASPEFTWLDGYLAFESEIHNRRYLQQVLQESGRQFVSPGQGVKPFISMLLKVDDYETWVRVCGADTAAELAEAANDVAFYQFQNRVPAPWPHYRGSEQFSLGFMRMSESAFAYYNGGSVLAGRKLDAVDARADFSAQVEMGHQSLTYDFTFRAGNISENRIAGIIGANGSGKTHSLLSISKALMGARSARAILRPAPSYNQVLVFAHSHSVQRFKLRRSHPSFGRQMIFALDPPAGKAVGLELTQLFTRMYRDFTYVDARPLHVLKELMDAEFQDLTFQVPTRSSRLDETPPYAEFGEFLGQFGEQQGLELIRRVDLDRPIRFSGTDGPRSLSLGQSVFLVFVFRALGHAGKASAFLIDEPENFLHPNLISKFVRVLHTILSRTQSVAIVATHSPYVVRELSRAQVHVLRKDEDLGMTMVSKPRLQTFGANVTAVSDDVFQDDLPEHLYLQRLRDSPRKNQSFEALLEQWKSELSMDALMRLRAIMEGRDDLAGPSREGS